MKPPKTKALNVPAFGIKNRVCILWHGICQNVGCIVTPMLINFTSPFDLSIWKDVIRYVNIIFYISDFLIIALLTHRGMTPAHHVVDNIFKWVSLDEKFCLFDLDFIKICSWLVH